MYRINKNWIKFSTLIPVVFILVACGPAQIETSAPTATFTAEADTRTLEQEPVDETSDQSKLPIADSACANGLLPLEVGNTWVYAMDPDDSILETADPDPNLFTTYTWSVVEVSETQATLEMTSEEPAFTANYILDCEDGAILTFPSVTLDLALGGGEFGSADLTYARGSGLFLPSLETFEQNNWEHEWETVMLLSGEIRTVIDDTQEFLVTMEESPFFFDWSTAGSGTAAFETIEVIAGEYEALKLNLETNMMFNIDMSGSNFSAEFTTDENQWYAPGVGLLQTRNNSAAMELSGMSLPMEDTEGDISLMLIEFRPGAE